MDGETKKGPGNDSSLNEEEAQTCIDTLRWMTQVKQIPMDDIVILTPYKAQKNHLNKLLNEIKGCKTVAHTGDTFQGSEAEYVIISLVKTVKEGAKVNENNQRLRFINDHRRTNVLLTRAKKGCIIICQDRAMEASPAWVPIGQMCKEAQEVQEEPDRKEG